MLNNIKYLEIRSSIPDGALLVYRPVSFDGLLVSISALPYSKWLKALKKQIELPPCHIARAIWWGNSLWTVQQTANPYKKLERLSTVLKTRSGKIDLYILKDEYKDQYSLSTALEVHKDICLRPYGWYNLLRIVPRHLPPLYNFIPKSINDSIVSREPPFCSMAYSMSDRAAGIDPCPGLSDKDTEPIDLTHSICYEYKCTLV